MAPTYPNRARELRARLLSQAAPPLEPVVVDGETYHLRAPTIADRDSVTRMALGAIDVEAKGKGMDVRIDKMMAAAAIALVCDEQGTPVFEPSDFDDLRNRPVGSSFEKLAALAMKRLNPSETPAGEALGDRPEPAGTTSSPIA